MNKDKIKVGDLVRRADLMSPRLSIKHKGVGLVVSVFADRCRISAAKYGRYRIYWFSQARLSNYNYEHQLAKLSLTQEEQNE